MAGDDPDFLEFSAGEFWALRRVGFLLNGDWDQAEELAQEAMARTYAVWPRGRGYDRPAAYAARSCSTGTPPCSAGPWSRPATWSPAAPTTATSPTSPATT